MSVIEGQQLNTMTPGECQTQLIVGDPGSGKTRYAGTAGDRNLIINVGGGIATLMSPEFKRSIGYNPHVITIQEDANAHGITEKATGIDNVGDTIEHWFDKRINDFDVITIDDLTAISQMASNKGMELGGRLRGSQSLAKAKAGRHIPIKEQGDYGIEIDVIRVLLSQLVVECQRHKKHLICLAHQRRYTVKSKGSQEPTLLMVGPLLAGKDSFAPQVVPGMFDDVWYFESQASSGKIVTSARTMPNAIYKSAKTRYGGVFQPTEENPHFLKMLDRIKKAHATGQLTDTKE